MNGISEAQRMLLFTLVACISVVWLEGQPRARTYVTSKLLWDKGGGGGDASLA